MVEETSARDVVKIYTVNEDEQETVMEWENQLFAVCTAFRKKIMDKADIHLPVKIVWKVTYKGENT